MSACRGFLMTFRSGARRPLAEDRFRGKGLRVFRRLKRRFVLRAVLPGAKHDPRSDLQIVLYTRGRVGQLRAQPIRIQRAQCEPVLQRKVYAPAYSHCQAIGRAVCLGNAWKAAIESISLSSKSLAKHHPGRMAQRP